VIRIEPALAHARQHIVGGDFRPPTSRATCICLPPRWRPRAAAGVDFQYSTTVTRLLLDGESHRRGMHRRARAPPPGARGCRGGGHGQLFRAPAAAAGHPVDAVSGQGILCHLSDSRSRQRTDRLADGRRPQARVFAPGRAPARGGHVRAERLHAGTQSRALRCHHAPRAGPVSPCLRLRRPRLLGRPAASRRRTCPTSAPRATVSCSSTRATAPGWTMGCGAGRALADLVSGRRPDVEFAFCGQRLAPQSAAAAFRVRPAGGIWWGAFRSRKD
jgi:D-amino-acid dehydrogenase